MRKPKVNDILENRLPLGSDNFVVVIKIQNNDVTFRNLTMLDVFTLSKEELHCYYKFPDEA
jgi:hypothetical protein